MKWRKLGHVFTPDGSKDWARSHAANPVAEQIEGSLFRIYFSTRDENNRSSIGSIEIDLRAPCEVLRVAEEPTLRPGELAMFDDCGVSIGCIVNSGQRRLLYYMGWHLTVAVPWQNALGLAISEGPGEPFERFSKFPVVGLCEIDPYTISYPWVTRENGKFRMWYGSNTRWGPKKEDMRHLLKYAESDDGLRWVRDDVVVVDFGSPEEYAICKPSVRKTPRGYQMWFSARGDAYRIYYAESEDGISWVRREENGKVDVSSSGWDSEMVEYPFVFDYDGQPYMLYCGNGFGRTGFGLAVLDGE